MEIKLGLFLAWLGCGLVGLWPAVLPKYCLVANRYLEEALSFFRLSALRLSVKVAKFYKSESSDLHQICSLKFQLSN